MADTKITSLQPPQVGYPVVPATDVLPIVVIADPGMATSGSTRKVTVNQLLGAGGTATLASATITGDLTVRTNQLIVNSSGVGVGTTPSAWSGIGPAIQVEQASLLSESSNQLYLTANGYFAGGQWNYINNASADQYYQIAGSHVWRNGAGGSPGTAIGWSTLMTLNSTGLGVGVSPVYKIHSVVASGYAGAFKSSTAVVGGILCGNTLGDLIVAVDASGNGRLTADTSKYLGLGSNGINDRVILDSSGNVGIGVTPSAWNNNYKAIDIADNGCIAGRLGVNNSVDIISNGFRNSSGNYVYKLATSNPAVRYLLDGSTGSHIWFSGAAGTAGNTIAGFSNALMTLDSSGNLILLPPSSPPALGTNGQLTVNATSNTNLRFSYRGSDGVTRTANLTLA